MTNIQLSNQTFFSPTPKFWTWLEQQEWLRWQQFWDIGAGMGHLTEAMVKSGRECIGVDICTRPSQSALVRIEDATQLNYDQDDCLLIARPSHGGFVEGVLRHAAGQAEVLYIGLERNLDCDLDGWHHELLIEDAGEDGEAVYRVLGRVEDMEEWCLLETDFWERPYWMCSKDGWWRSKIGGGFPKKPGMRVLERRLFGNPYQMHCSLEDICPQNEEQVDGWITPTGQWYGGEYAQHADILTYVLGITEARAEAVGFVRCYGGHLGGHPFWTSHRGRTTRQQRTKMRQLGLHTRDDFQDQREIE